MATEKRQIKSRYTDKNRASDVYCGFNCAVSLHKSGGNNAATAKSRSKCKAKEN